MKKGEAWLNTFTPAVSYMLRCNHDVTSLLSGTAIKSVIAYVADYITKTPLKTHVMFKSIQQVFERNTELLGSRSSTRDKARSIITKIVNALTASSEIGGPMAAMYLLKHPDHYTGHKFKTCLWKSYVCEVMKAWDDSAALGEEQKTKVMLGIKRSGQQQQVVALSPVIDYMWRPVEYEDTCLYDWIRLHDKTKMAKKRRGRKPDLPAPSEDVECDSNFENDYGIEDNFDTGEQNQQLADDINFEYSDEDDEEQELKGGAHPLAEEEEESEDELLLTTKSNKVLAVDIEKDKQQHKPKTKSKYMRFHPNHPQYNTHQVLLVDESQGLVPNFVGGAIPRRDGGGSREEYCLTMLTLFKPWRSGNDLRPNKDTLWHDVFTSHTFSSRQGQVMDNFMIKYECNDAQDDFSAQRKKMEKGYKMPMNLDREDLDDLDTQHYREDYDEYQEESEALITAAEALAEPTSRELTRRSQQQSLATTVNAVGWLDEMDNKPPTTRPKRMKFSEDKTASQWKQLLADKRQSILDERDAQADQNEKAKNHKAGDKNAGEVKIVGQNYFLSKDFKASNKEAQKLIDDTAAKFSLNEAQERAFRIVANHAVESNGEQLKMYLGGMAGTGKSQVIKALSHFFATRKESYRFMCLAPTGAAAALIGGSTYHSVLGVNRSAKKEVLAALIQTRAKLQNVDYVFVDEIVEVGALAPAFMIAPSPRSYCTYITVSPTSGIFRFVRVAHPIEIQH